jgi:hypothetical protein
VGVRAGTVSSEASNKKRIGNATASPTLYPLT